MKDAEWVSVERHSPFWRVLYGFVALGAVIHLGFLVFDATYQLSRAELLAEIGDEWNRR